MLTSAKIVSQSSHRRPSFMLVLARNLEMTATVSKIEKMIAKSIHLPRCLTHLDDANIERMIQ